MGVNVFDLESRMQRCQICQEKLADSDVGVASHYRRFHGVNRTMPMPKREWIPMDPKAKKEITDRVESDLSPFVVDGTKDDRVLLEPFGVGWKVKEWGLGRPSLHHVQTMHPEFSEQDIALFYQGYDYKGE